jgi:hypothetical protein
VLAGTPAPSAADAVVQADVRALIGKAEATKGRATEVRVVETRALPSEGSHAREAWVIDGGAEGRRFVYLVVLEPSLQGGTGISLSGPWGVGN